MKSIQELWYSPIRVAFLGQMEIIEVETICLCEIGFEITMVDNSVLDVNTCKEMWQMLDTMFAPYVASQDITHQLSKEQIKWQ